MKENNNKNLKKNPILTETLHYYSGLSLSTADRDFPQLLWARPTGCFHAKQKETC